MVKKLIILGLREDGKGIIISVSRGISKSSNPRVAAKTLVEEMQALIRQHHSHVNIC